MKNSILLLFLIHLSFLSQAQHQPINVALGKPVSASSTHRSVTPGGAVDGNYTNFTRWVSQVSVDDDSDPDVHWLDIELLSLFEVSSFVLAYDHWNEEQPLSFRFLVLDPLTGEFVEASQNPNLTLENDTVGYLAEGRGDRAIVFVDTFPQSYKTNRIRFEFTTGDGLRARFYELEVYGKQVKGPDAPTNLTFKPKFDGLANKELEISWTDNSSDEARFVITKGALAGDQTVRVIATLEADETSFVDREFGQFFGASYVYTVAALNAAGAASTDLVDTASFHNPYNIALGKNVWANSSSDDKGPISVVTDGLKASDLYQDRWQNLRDSELPDIIAVDLDSVHAGVNAFALFTGWDGLNTSPRRFDVLVRNADITDAIHMDTAISVTGNTDGSFFSFFDKPYHTDSVVLLVYERDGPFVRLKELEIYQWPEDVIWDGAAWSNGTGPNGFSKVFINGNITVNTLLTGSEITVAEGVVVKVDQGGDLYANGERHTYSYTDQGVLGHMINNGEIRVYPGGKVRWDAEFKGNNVLVPGVPNLMEPIISFTETDTSITLKWEDTADDETRFLVERKDGNYLDLNDTMGWHIDTLGWQLIATVDLQPLTGDTVEYIDKIPGFIIGRKYEYRVTAASFLDSSRISNIKKVSAPREGNLAYKKPTSAKDVTGNNVSANAVDGDIFSNNSRWVNNNNLPTWWSVDLGAVYSIDSVVFYINDGGDEFGNPLDSFSVQAWNGSRWYDILVEGGNNNSIYRARFDINSFISSRIRLNVQKAAGDNYVRLLEFEVFGSEYEFPAPSNLTAQTNSLGTQIDLNWTDNSSNEMGFIILRKGSGLDSDFIRIDSVAANVTTYSDASVKSKTDYTYKIVGFTATVSSVSSNTAIATTKPVPLPPSQVKADTVTNSSTKLILSWTDNSDYEDSFFLERKSEHDSVFLEVVTLSPNSIQFLDTGLNHFTEYSYRLKAKNLRGFSPYSKIASGRTLKFYPLPPTNLEANAISPSQIELSWVDQEDHELGFVIERRTDGSDYTPIALIEADVEQYVDRNLKSNTSYTYRIYSHNERGDSRTFSNEANDTTFDPIPEAPSVSSVMVHSETEIQILWENKSTYADSFQIERSIDTSKFIVVGIASSTDTTFLDSLLKPNTKYEYRIAALNEAGISKFSNIVTATTLAYYPKAPSQLSVNAISHDQIKLKWVDNSNNEEGFIIQRKEHLETPYQVIDTIKSNGDSIVDDFDLKESTTYYYQVIAINSRGLSEVSNMDSATTLQSLPLIPSDLAAQPISENQIHLTWTDLAFNENYYIIQRKEEGNEFINIDTLVFNTESYHDSASLIENTLYIYRLVTGNSRGEVLSSQIQTATLLSFPKAVSGFDANPKGEKEIELTWLDNAFNEGSYILQRKQEDSQFISIDTLEVDTEHYLDTIGLEENTPYVYRIFSINDRGASPFAVKQVSTLLSHPIAVSNLQVISESSHKITLSWVDNAFNEDAFLIQRKVKTETDFKTIDSLVANTTSYEDSLNLEENTEYIYRVQVSNLRGTTSSDEIEAMTLISFPLEVSSFMATALSSTKVRLTWNDQAFNEDAFIVMRKRVDDQDFVSIDTLTANSTEFVDSILLSEKTEYAYLIITQNSRGTSKSVEQKVTTLLSYPISVSDLTAQAMGTSKIKLSWIDNAFNEDLFVVQRKQDDQDFSIIDTLDANTTSYIDSIALSENTRYIYRIMVANGRGSTTSEEQTATTFLSKPLAPSNFTASAKGAHEVELSWTDNAFNEKGYIIQRSENSNGNFQTIDTLNYDMSSYNDSELQPNTTYTYLAIAYNSRANSDPSDFGTATTEEILSTEDLLQDINISPNPFDKKLLISTSYTRLLSIQIFNVNGKQMESLPIVKTKKGYQAIWHPQKDKGLKSGIYFVKVNFGDDVIVKRVIFK